MSFSSFGAVLPAAYAASEFDEGAGTEVSPYVITTAQQLDAIRDGDYSDKAYKLGADIDLSSIPNWDPIMNFSGSLDGAGYSISGLAIRNLDAGNVGLFGQIDKGMVKNVIIKDAVVDASNSAGALAGSITSDTQLSNIVLENVKVTSAHNAGALAGTLAAGSKIIDVKAKDVHLTGTAGVGGIAGIGDGTILNSSVTGEIAGTTQVGGIAGILGNASAGTVKDSYSTAVVSGTGDVGGLIGLVASNSWIANSYSTGAVTVNANKDQQGFGGGLVGVLSKGWVQHSYFDMASIAACGTPCSGDSNKGEAKSAEDLKKKETYRGWNFSTVWKINEGETLPELQQANISGPVTFAAFKEILKPTNRGWDYIYGLEVQLYPFAGNGRITKTEYSVNQGDWQTYSVPFTIETAKTYNIRFRSVDSNGHTEKEWVADFRKGTFTQSNE